VVAIIRGGGGDVGLSSYNSYTLAKEIALFPIPVLTGIGHSTNETVAEMVSFKTAITPTELADFLIQKFHNFSAPIKRAEEIMVERSKRILTDEKIKFRSTIKYFRSVTNTTLMHSRAEIRSQSESVLQHSKFLMKRKTELMNWSVQELNKAIAALIDVHKKRIENGMQKTKVAIAENLSKERESLYRIEKNVDILDPVNILKRGFSITLHNGKALKSKTEVKPGDILTTILVDGQIESEVNDSAKYESQ
jgi:exodeoxyribonuclease VII large subunit